MSFSILCMLKNVILILELDSVLLKASTLSVTDICCRDVICILLSIFYLHNFLFRDYLLPLWRNRLILYLCVSVSVYVRVCVCVCARALVCLVCSRVRCVRQIVRFTSKRIGLLADGRFSHNMNQNRSERQSYIYNNDQLV